MVEGITYHHPPPSLYPAIYIFESWNFFSGKSRNYKIVNIRTFLVEPIFSASVETVPTRLQIVLFFSD